MRERTTRLLIASVIGAVVAVVSNRVDAEFSSLRVSVASTVFNDILIGFVAGLCAFAWASLLTNRHFRRSLVKRMREEGVQRERARMAREIHDTFAQGLGGIVLSLEAAQDFLEQSPEAKKLCDRALWIARESLAEARSLLRGSQSQQECKTFRDAVAQLAERITHGTGLRPTCSVAEISGALSAETESELLGIIREALSNVVRHADASEVHVSLRAQKDQFQLCVEDNGRGFNPGDPQTSRGFGLTSMRERASDLGGLLWIYTQPRQGTQVVAFVPVRAEEESNKPWEDLIPSESPSPTTTWWSAKASSRS